MNDLEKLKNHFEGFKNLEFINSESVQSRVDAFERFCRKGVPSLKQEHWSVPIFNFRISIRIALVAYFPVKHIF